jgi:TPR repeat protein
MSVEQKSQLSKLYARRLTLEKDMPSNDLVNAGQHSALKVTGSVFLGIAAILALGFLFALWISGVLWVSEKIVGYVWMAADTAFWVCLIVLLPLSLFRATRKISCIGFLGASFSFGLCTWILGFLTTYEYWGGLGVFVGLVLGVVGIVPLGILASIFHADWTSAIFLTIGLLLTYSARSFALWLAIKIDSSADLLGRAGTGPIRPPAEDAATPENSGACADTISARDRITQSGSDVASVSLLPENYEPENDTTQEAVQDAEQAQRSDWEVATGYYPDLDAICTDLRRISPNLAIAFRATLLETKQFPRRKELAQRLEDDFLQTYFGRNPKTLDFAHTLMVRGHKAAAKELNRAISVLGRGADENLIIERIREKFDLGPTYTRSARKFAEALSRLSRADLDLTGFRLASSLIKELGGTVTVRYVELPTLGEQRYFLSKRELVVWVKDTIVPQVLQGQLRAEEDQAAKVEASAVAARADTINATDQRTQPGTYTQVIEAGTPDAQEASALAAPADIISADPGGASGKPQQSRRRTLVTAGVLALFISGALFAAVLARPQTPVPPNAAVTARAFTDAVEAYRRGDYATALRLLRPLADQGNANAQFRLGSMYYHGRGLPQDYAEAAKWYRLAADQGNANAQNNLGWSFYNGHGVPQDYAEAAKWYRLAADQGNAKAQFELGAMYYSGYSVLKDYITAHMWLSLSLARQKDEKLRDSILKLRDLVEKGMTPAQIAEAQRRVLEWQPKMAYKTSLQSTH